MSKSEVKRIFVDMDGVLADFISGCSKMIGQPLKNDAEGHSEYDKRKPELTNKRLFRNLPPTVDMYELIAYIKHTHLPWEILSAAGSINRELVVFDKTKWIEQYVDPSIVVTCTFNGRQKAMFAKKGSVLIDDVEDNIDAWEKAGGIGILHVSAENTIKALKLLRNPVSLH